ncbi:integral membrane protein [Sarocladium implicatum]|nr:integral membrane protein [Sarocladium implicatum]
MPIHKGVEVLALPPPDYEVDFDNPRREAVPVPYYVAAFGATLTLIFMAQRIFVKLRLSGGLQLDDYLLLLAWTLAMITIALCVHMFANGAGGVHIWEISVDTYLIYAMDVWIASWIYCIAGSLAKISLLIFYLRLSPQPWFRWAVWGTMAFIGSYSIGIVFSLIFACKPISMAWDIRVGGECIDMAVLYIVTAAANICSDLVLFCLPIPMVYNLQIPRRQKLGLLFIFLIGSLTVVTSVVRVAILPGMLTNLDLTWAISWASVWIIVEANLLIICAALPTVRKFFRHVAPRFIGEYSRNGTTSRSRTNAKSGLSALKSGNIVTIGGSGSGGGGNNSSHASRRDRHQYSQFDDDVNSNSAGSVEEIALVSAGKGFHREQRVSGGRTQREEVGVAHGGWVDSDSDKAIVMSPKGSIVQTTSITVEYSQKNKPERTERNKS